MTLRVYAPATTANLAAGFDSLGIALQPCNGILLGDIVHIDEFHETCFELSGASASILPQQIEDNLTWVAWKNFSNALDDKNRRLRPARIRLEKNLPISSGLGSSASSIVATLVALNKFHEQPFSNAELLVLAGKTEGRTSGDVHLDNVAPCLLGGMQLIAPKNVLAIPCTTLPFACEWRLVVVHPHFELQTKKARGVLPNSLPLKTCVEQNQHLAALVTGLFGNDEELIRIGCTDLIAEPARASMIPGYHSVKKAAMNLGAIASNLSGSGPSVFAWTHESNAPLIMNAMQQAFREAGLTSTAWVCIPDVQGARVL